MANFAKHRAVITAHVKRRCWWHDLLPLTSWPITGSRREIVQFKCSRITACTCVLSRRCSVVDCSVWPCCWPTYQGRRAAPAPPTVYSREYVVVPHCVGASAKPWRTQAVATLKRREGARREDEWGDNGARLHCSSFILCWRYPDMSRGILKSWIVTAVMFWPFMNQF